MTGTKDYEQEQCWRANEWMGLERAASGEHKTNPEVLFLKKKKKFANLTNFRSICTIEKMSNAKESEICHFHIRKKL